MSQFVSTDPTSEQPLRTYPEVSAREMDALLEQARSAFLEWRQASLATRLSVLAKTAAVLRQRKDVLARLITSEMGKPLVDALAEVEKSAWACAYYAEHGEAMLAPEAIGTELFKSYVRFEPLGPILAIMPWNFPFWQVFRCIAPTLLVGNTVVLKHAETTFGCGQAIEEVLLTAGASLGVLSSVVAGRARAHEILADARVRGVSLTGSVSAGRAVGRSAGELLKPCVLELGGSDPCIVLADANFEEAVAGAVTGRMINGGQSCIAAKRIIVESSIYERFVEAFDARIAKLVVGDPRDATTQVGPMARADLRDALLTQVQRSVDHGARLVRGGKALSRRGYFIEPTVLADVAPGMAAFDEETFGPVAALVRARDEAHAIELANASRYGLGASIWSTREHGEGLSPRLEAGHVAINGIVKSDPRLPFGGVKDSGVGRELSRYGALSFANLKTVTVA